MNTFCTNQSGDSHSVDLMLSSSMRQMLTTSITSLFNHLRKGLRLTTHGTLLSGKEYEYQVMILI